MSYDLKTSRILQPWNDEWRLTNGEWRKSLRSGNLSFLASLILGLRTFLLSFFPANHNSIREFCFSIQNRNLPHAAARFFQSKIRNLKSKIKEPASGFTLMEILLAFLILSIVVTTILGSFNAVFSTTDTLENSGKYYDMAKSCLNRMKTDLEALYVTQPPFYKKPEFDDPPDNYRFVGSMEDSGGTSFAKVRFTSRAHIPFASGNRGGIAEIIYYVQAKNDGQMVLKRSDHLYPYPQFEENGSDPVMCRYVKSLAFKYFDADGEESETWNSDEDDYDYATPTAVGIVLEIGSESETYAFETTVKLAVHRKKLE